MDDNLSAEPTKQSQQKNGQRDQTKSRAVFYLIAILLPFAFLALFELVLRVSGFGHQYPLFIEASSPLKAQSTLSGSYLQPNPEVVKRFFHLPEFAPPVEPDTFLFKQEKQKGTYRIVLMGGSSAAGFPYGRFGSPAGLLKQQLKSVYPDKNIEVLSVAMASINTYALLDFTQEVIDIQPDLVLIYAGHNEYLGVMGVGSVYSQSNSRATNLLFLKLKELRLFQLVQGLYYWLKPQTEPFNHNDSSRTVMASVAKEKNIPLDSELYAAGKTQFKENLSTIVKLFSQADIPVLLSSIASNERNQAPFESMNSTSANSLISPDKPRSSQRIIQQGVSLIENGEQSADLAFAIAQAYEKTNQMSDALTYYKKARDYDLLRFRAPSEFNDIIAEIAASHKLVTFVDADEKLRNDTETGIIGEEHMLEHLHPNTRGYFMIALSYLEGIVDGQFLPSPKSAIETDDLWRTQSMLRSDIMLAEYKIAVLKSDYPFTATKQTVRLPSAKDAIEELALKRIAGMDWLSAQQALLSLYQEQEAWLEAATVAGLMFDALPERGDIARIASLLYLRVNQLGLAEYYARKAIQYMPTLGLEEQGNYYLSLGETLFKSGDVNGAIEVLDALLVMQPMNQKALAIRQRISPP